MANKIPLSKREEIFKRDKGKCKMCGMELSMKPPINPIDMLKKDTNYYTIDHIKPVSKGGKNNIENLRLLCRKCNCSKNNRNADDYIETLTQNVLNILEFSKKELLINDYVKNGEKNSLIDGFEKLKMIINLEIEKELNLIKRLEGE